MPSDPVELAAVRTWPTTDAGGVFAPTGDRASPRQTRQAVTLGRWKRGRHVHIGDESLVVPQYSTPMAAELAMRNDVIGRE